MKNTVRAGLAIMGLSATLVVGIGYGTASAGGRSSVTGKDVKTAIATANFDARNTGNSDEDAKGNFKGAPPSPVNALLSLEGPVTCLHVEGNKAGFLYPVVDNSRPFFIKGTYVLISVEDGGKGGTDRMGFTGPAPKEFFSNCNPQFTPLEVTSGDIVVKDKG